MKPVERPLIERDLDAMQLLEWALEFGDTDYAATQIAGAIGLASGIQQ